MKGLGIDSELRILRRELGFISLVYHLELFNVFPLERLNILLVEGDQGKLVSPRSLLC